METVDRKTADIMDLRDKFFRISNLSWNSLKTLDNVSDVVRRLTEICESANAGIGKADRLIKENDSDKKED